MPRLKPRSAWPWNSTFPLFLWVQITCGFTKMEIQIQQTWDSAFMISCQWCCSCWSWRHPWRTTVLFRHFHTLMHVQIISGSCQKCRVWSTQSGTGLGILSFLRAPSWGLFCSRGPYFEQPSSHGSQIQRAYCRWRLRPTSELSSDCQQLPADLLWQWLCYQVVSEAAFEDNKNPPWWLTTSGEGEG